MNVADEAAGRPAALVFSGREGNVSRRAAEIAEGEVASSQKETKGTKGRGGRMLREWSPAGDSRPQFAQRRSVGDG